MNKIRTYPIRLVTVKVVRVVRKRQNYLNRTGLEIDLRQTKVETNLVLVGPRHFPVPLKKNHQRVEKSMNRN